MLANRLSADPRNRVLLVEAGPRDRSPWLKIPAGTAKVFVHPTLNWGYSTEPEPHLGNRTIYWPRGKTLGGSSAINGMAYMRGQPEDYDHWRQLGNIGWSWDDVLPYFRTTECHEDGADPWHGASGELAVSDPRLRHPASQAFLDSAFAAGIPPTADFNGERQEGAAFFQFTIRDGLRHSSASAFLKPALSRPNLSVQTDAQVERVLIEGGRATGLAYRVGGVRREAKAREIILSAGAINSPQLLMLSGIGPGARLREHGLDVVLDLPGVGENLQDHIYVHHLSRVPPGYSINRSMRGWRLLPHAIDFALRRRGILTLGASQSGAFLRSSERVDRPDLQLMFKPYNLVYSPEGGVVPTSEPGITTSVSHVRPLSRGRVFLKSGDPRAAPGISANYLAEQEDRDALVAGIAWIRRIFAKSPLRDIVSAETAPGPGIGTDEEIVAFIRAHAQSMYHPVGTCRMGMDEHAVVDARLRVRGINGLRIADASVMPTIPSGNTNAPSIMIGAKAADMILEDMAARRVA